MSNYGRCHKYCRNDVMLLFFLNFETRVHLFPFTVHNSCERNSSQDHLISWFDRSKYFHPRISNWSLEGDIDSTLFLWVWFSWVVVFITLRIKVKLDWRRINQNWFLIKVETDEKMTERQLACLRLHCFLGYFFD